MDKAPKPLFFMSNPERNKFNKNQDKVILDFSETINTTLLTDFMGFHLVL